MGCGSSTATKTNTSSDININSKPLPSENININDESKTIVISKQKISTPNSKQNNSYSNPTTDTNQFKSETHAVIVQSNKSNIINHHISDTAPTNIISDFDTNSPEYENDHQSHHAPKPTLVSKPSHLSHGRRSRSASITPENTIPTISAINSTHVYTNNINNDNIDTVPFNHNNNIQYNTNEHPFLHSQHSTKSENDDRVYNVNQDNINDINEPNINGLNTFITQRTSSFSDPNQGLNKITDIVETKHLYKTHLEQSYGFDLEKLTAVAV